MTVNSFIKEKLGIKTSAAKFPKYVKKIFNKIVNKTKTIKIRLKYLIK